MEVAAAACPAARYKKWRVRRAHKQGARPIFKCAFLSARAAFFSPVESAARLIARENSDGWGDVFCFFFVSARLTIKL